MSRRRAKSVRMQVTALMVFILAGQLSPAQDVQEAKENRTWTNERLVELRGLGEHDRQSSDEIIARAMEIARQAAVKGAENVLHNALGAVITRANISSSDSIILQAQSDRAIRLGLLPWLKLLYEKSGNDVRVLELLGGITLEPENGHAGHYQLRAVGLIHNLTKDEEILRRLLLPVAMRSPPTTHASHSAARIVAPFVRHEDLESMRPLAIASLKNPKYPPFHPVVYILAYQGDIELLPHLERALGKLQTDRLTRKAPFWKAIWKIQTQNPPRKLLDAIRTEHPARDRAWMMERAVALDVNRDQVRTAVLEYARQQINPSDPGWMAQRPRIVDCAQRLDILTSDEIKAMPPADPKPKLRVKAKT